MFTLRFAGGSHEATLYPGRSVLDSIEADGRELVAIGCRRGGCGLCKVRILEGHYSSKKMSRAHISPEDEDNGYVLACRVIPESSLLLQQGCDAN